jgi:hypothetical protein
MPTERDAANFGGHYDRPREGCWLFRDQPHANIPTFRIGGLRGRTVPVRRASWLIHRGPVPDGKIVSNWCENARCVRPDHLTLTTRAAVRMANNEHQRRLAGRPQRGE